MAQPRPRDEFESDGEYLKDFWVMSEFGVDESDYELFRDFFGGGDCPQTEEEQKHYDELPSTLKIYRGYNTVSRSLDSMSWTPCKREAEGFAYRSALYEEVSRRHGGNPNTDKVTPIVATMTIGKGNIDSVLLGRELEYIITCPDILDHEPSIEERPDLVPFQKEAKE